jgi:hypothetical protein
MSLVWFCLLWSGLLRYGSLLTFLAFLLEQEVVVC